MNGVPQYAADNLTRMTDTKLAEHERHLLGARIALQLLAKGDDDATRHATYTGATLARYHAYVVAEINRRKG